MNIGPMPYEYFSSEKITTDYLNYASHVKQIFPKHFKEPSIRKFSVHREKIVERLLSYNQRLNAPKQVIKNIESLSQPKTYAVITGQQPGIFSGPLYTVYKALSTITICERFSDEKHSFVPIFWNASEDDDISEVNHISIFKQNEPYKIRYNCESKGLAFSHMGADKSELKKILTIVDSISPNSQFKAPLLKKINEIIEASSTLGDFFSRFMMYLFGDFGLIMIEPVYLRDLMVPVFRRLITEPTECTHILAETSLKLKELGYSPKIHKKSNLCNFFVFSDDGKRLRVTYNGRFQVANKTFSQQELLCLLDNNPSRFSANAIIRPVTQDYIFPTFAYVAGPNEIAYLAQLRGIYEFFSLEMPVIFPRFGATIVEKKIYKVIDKYKIKIHELKNPEKLMKNLAKKKMSDVFEKMRNRVSSDIAEVTRQAIFIDEALAKSSSIARTKILKAIDVLEDKVESKLKQRDEVMKQQIVKAYNNLFPYGDLQERRINVLEYLIKFGKKFLRTVHDDFFSAGYDEHRVIKC